MTRSSSPSLTSPRTVDAPTPTRLFLSSASHLTALDLKLIGPYTFHRTLGQHPSGPVVKLGTDHRTGEAVVAKIVMRDSCKNPGQDPCQACSPTVSALIKLAELQIDLFWVSVYRWVPEVDFGILLPVPTQKNADDDNDAGGGKLTPHETPVDQHRQMQRSSSEAGRPLAVAMETSVPSNNLPATTASQGPSFSISCDLTELIRPHNLHPDADAAHSRNHSWPFPKQQSPLKTRSFFKSVKLFLQKKSSKT